MGAGGTGWRILALRLQEGDPGVVQLQHLGLIFSFTQKNIDRLSLMLGAWDAEINKTHLLPPKSSLSSKGEGKAKSYKKNHNIVK